MCTQNQAILILREVYEACKPIFGEITGALSVIRTNSDYDDFYVISKKLIVQQIHNAERFIIEVKNYMSDTTSLLGASLAASFASYCENHPR